MQEAARDPQSQRGCADRATRPRVVPPPSGGLTATTPPTLEVSVAPAPTFSPLPHGDPRRALTAIAADAGLASDDGADRTIAEALAPWMRTRIRALTEEAMHRGLQASAVHAALERFASEVAMDHGAWGPAAVALTRLAQKYALLSGAAGRPAAGAGPPA